MRGLQLYRSVLPEKYKQDIIYGLEKTRRPPGNVPYIVDNLWEWVRPGDMPCRRFSAYASPTPELALESGATGGKVFQIEFIGRFKIAQLKGHADSKFHPDCKTLKKFLIRSLGKKWAGLDLKRKLTAGHLWIPCIDKEEITDIFEQDTVLHALKDKIINQIKYWDDVAPFDLSSDILPDSKGEIFFEAIDGYQLIPV